MSSHDAHITVTPLLYALFSGFKSCYDFICDIWVLAYVIIEYNA